MKPIRFLPEEEAMLTLRELFRARGFLTFKMSKFEEYDLYGANKDFLVSDSVITFTDRTGRLLALKPDVTLSIVKNYRYEPGVCEKICYAERVYRPARSGGEYREIPQVGLECIGDLDPFHQLEVVSMAARSLELLGAQAVLEIGHLGILSAFLAMTNTDDGTKHKLTEAIGQKNAHDLALICKENGIDPAVEEKLTALVSLYGTPDAVLPRLEALVKDTEGEGAFAEIAQLCAGLSQIGIAPTLLLDFSIVQDMRYYCGIVFRGYLSSIPDRVLSGGCYDPLLAQMGKQGGAIGFAVYLDLLAPSAEEPYDADILLLYDDTDAPAEIIAKARALGKDGKTVMTQKNIPEKLRFETILTVKGEKK